MARIEFADLLKRDFQALNENVRSDILVEAANFEREWKGRFGDNAQVRQDGGPAPELAKSTVRHKKHERMLEETFELRDSIDNSGVRSADAAGWSAEHWAIVSTSHWLFPIHEYLLHAPPNWVGDLRRQTLTPTEMRRGQAFVKQLYSRFLNAVDGRGEFL